MVRVPCCDEKPGLKKGPWTSEEDHKLSSYIQSHGHTSWRALPKQAGLSRCGKSCRLRWTNYLRPGIKRGNFSQQEENTIIQLHAALGNRWSTISTHLPGRTDNEIKNHWNTRLRKRLLKMGIDPTTHRPWVQPLPSHSSSIDSLLLSLLQAAPSAPDANSSLLNALLLGSKSFANINGLFPAAPGHVLQTNATAPVASAPASSILPPPAALDPTALIAAAETRLILDYLKFHNGENPDHRLNQLLTRLLLLKLLQGSNNQAPPSPNPAAWYDNKAPIHNISTQQRSGPLSTDQLLLPAANNHQTAAPPAPPSAYVNPTFCAAFNDNKHNSISTTMLWNMFSSSYQQSLLQSLPFLAESVIEPCTTADNTDHLSSTSSHQLSQASFFNCQPELTAPNGSLTSQPNPLWLGHAAGSDNETLPSGAQLLARQSPLHGDSHLMASGAQILAGAPDINQVGSGGSEALMTWEEHVMSEQKGRDTDIASSSTVSSSTLSSTASPCQYVTPNFNVQDYWSDLLNLISSTK